MIATLLGMQIVFPSTRTGTMRDRLAVIFRREEIVGVGETKIAVSVGDQVLRRRVSRDFANSPPARRGMPLFQFASPHSCHSSV